jgi:Holliday junction resolvase-like predicted endonuclease
VAENDHEMIFIEVKAVHHTDDLHNYITPTKLSALKRTIEYYLRHHSTKKPIRLDIAFVKWNIIFDIYRNVTNN